jgi:hypothetical protein
MVRASRGDVLLAEEVRCGVGSSDGVQEDQVGPGLSRGPGLVEPDVPAPSDPQELEVDAPGAPDRLLVGLAIPIQVVAGDGAVGDVDVLRGNVDVLEEVLPHETDVAVGAVRLHGVVLVQVEGHDPGDADGGGSGRQAQDGMTPLGVPLPDDGGDAAGHGPGHVLVAVHDDHRDVLQSVPHGVPLPSVSAGQPLVPKTGGLPPYQCLSCTASSTMARTTASCTALRKGTCLLFSRVGFVRDVRRTTNRSSSGSTQREVPVKPV